MACKHDSFYLGIEFGSTRIKAVAIDEKHNPVYKVGININGAGSIGQFGIVANTFIDGRLTVVIVEPLGTTKEEIKAKYGKAVVAANKYCPVIASAAASEEEIIDAAFGDFTEAVETVAE